MPVNQGIDTALDRLFRKSVTEKLSGIGTPEELNPRFTGVPERLATGTKASVTPVNPMATDNVTPSGFPSKKIQDTKVPPDKTGGEEPPPPPPLWELGLQWLASPFSLYGEAVRNEEQTRLWDDNNQYRAKILKSPEEISKIVNRPATEVKDWLPGGKKYQEYWELPFAEQVKYELPLWLASFLLPSSGEVKLAIQGGKYATASKFAKLGMNTLSTFYKAITGDIVFEPFKLAGKIPVGKAVPIPAKVAEVAGHSNKLLDEVVNAVKNPPKLVRPTVGQKISEFGTKIEEALTDKFAGINKMAARNKAKYGGELPYEIDAELQTALLPGVTGEAKQMAEDTFTKVQDVIGKNKNLEPYVDAYLVLRHQADVIANHPKRVFFGGKTVQDIQDAITALQKDLGENVYSAVEKAASVVKKHYDDILELDVNSGLVGQELADLLRTKYPWYNPIQYYRDAAGQIGQASYKPISVDTSGIRRLSELGSEVAQERPLNTLLEATLNRMTLIRRNEAAKAIVRLAEVDEQFGNIVKKVKTIRPIAQVEGEPLFRPVKRAIKGTISFLEDGKRVAYEVPQVLEREAKFLADIGFTNLEQVAMAVNSVSRTAITGANPIFYVSNMAIDSLTAVLSQGTSPFRIGKRLLSNLKDIVSKDELLRNLRLNRGEVMGFSGADPKVIARKAREAGQLVLEKEEDWRRLLNPKNIVETLEKIGHAVEMAPRSAVFEQQLAKGLPIEKAALAARRVTIDFSRSGTAIRHANAFWLYLNAGLQGTMIPFRALRDNPVSRYMTAGYMGATIANYGWNRQFPEYEDVPDYIKYGSTVVMLPSEEYDSRGNKVPHYLTVIPNLREFSAFSAPIVYALRKLDEKQPGDVSTFLTQLGTQLNPLSSIAGHGGISAPTQLGGTITEIAMNRDPFRDRAIVPEEMEGLPKPEQYDKYTSLTARKAGEYLNQSPLKIDYFFNNVFGGLGKTVKSGIDAVINYIEPENADPRIVELYHKLNEIKPPNILPEEVGLRRDEFLYSLSVEDRQAVLDLEREPETSIPLITPMKRKLYKDYGGQIYKTGQQLAEVETGISAKQTTNASKILSQYNQLVDQRQEELDKQVMAGTKTMQEWREERSVFSDQYQGALMAVGILYPQSGEANPDKWEDYTNAVYTLASSMPDMRARSDILRAGYYAINPVEDPITEEMDWDDFYRRRDDFKVNLIPDDKKLLERELKSRMSSLEKGYWDIAEDKRISQYYDLPVGKYRTLYRESDPDFDALLNLGGFVTTTRSTEALVILKKKCEALGIPFESTPAVKGILSK